MGCYYVIECTIHGAISYYTRGIFLKNIPLETATKVRLLKCTHVGKKGFYHDCTRGLEKFQRLWKAWYRLVRNPRTYLLRETGALTLKRFSPRRYLQ